MMLKFEVFFLSNNKLFFVLNFCYVYIKWLSCLIFKEFDLCDNLIIVVLGGKFFRYCLLKI